MKRTLCHLLLGVAMTLAACQPSAPDTEHAAEEPHPDAGSADHSAGAAHDAESHAGHGGEDSHEALPLRPIMQQLGVAMTGFTQALWLEEYERMEEFAEDVAGHAHISDEEMQRIRAELGQEMEDFIAVDEAVHDAAVRLHAATEARDMDRILQQLSEVQTGCASCHTRFRERLRTDRPVP